MLEGRSRYFEYLGKKKIEIPEAHSRRSLKRTFPLVLISFALLFVAQAEARFVDSSRFEIPQDVQEYMLEYEIWRFSYDTFRGLCLSNGLSERTILLLASIYYSHWAFLTVGFVMPWVYAIDELRLSRRRRSFSRKSVLFHQVMRLHRCLDELSYDPRTSEKRQTISLIKSLHLYDIISPLKKRWQADPAFRWFQENPLSKETIRVLAALKSFRKKALYCVHNDHDIRRLADVANELATFLYLVSLQEETEYRSPRLSREEADAPAALARFADALNRIQIKAEVKPTLARRMLDGVNTISQSRPVRLIFVIATTAAIVLAFGARLFRIPASTAFLAWVSIVFGSTLLGIASSVPDMLKGPE